jgi:hypothetical protein
MLYGPNTNYYNVTFMLERQAEFIARAVKRMARTGSTAIEVRQWVMDLYNRLVERSLAGQVAEAGCNNYYHSASGRNVLTYPWTASTYVVLTRLGGLASFTRRAATEPVRKHLPLERATGRIGDTR